MKNTEYFYIEKANQELQQKIKDLIIECKLEISNVEIKNMKVNDLKMMNAYIKSRLEAMKPTHFLTTAIAFAVAILTIILTTSLTMNAKTNASFVLIMCGVIFAYIFFSCWAKEKKYKKNLESCHYLMNLLDIYIEEKEEEKRIDKI
ncbi:hypothetical protein CN676_10385 [Bacillus wiedmannii]|uniref:hypothetical protein n=1 Tax=Bacillus wiedmannii TaxID=1890302 RepID=UPI000BF16154|nr:hypothetical protein [Bacillus wiedmannii]PEJ53027.1 hypothetical protein CN676_10385 [Bacillus wiedmannii]PGE57132.1 hypothetical protein COM65_24900 [Bacillus wiedmannii]PHE73263.1 hypothetical protein COF47_22785 [Bacillus wiedmannii]